MGGGGGGGGGSPGCHLAALDSKAFRITARASWIVNSLDQGVPLQVVDNLLTV